MSVTKGTTLVVRSNMEKELGFSPCQDVSSNEMLVLLHHTGQAREKDQGLKRCVRTRKGNRRSLHYAALRSEFVTF